MSRFWEALLKVAAKQSIKSALVHLRIPKLIATVLPSSVCIVRYHSVQDEPERYRHSIGTGIIHSTSTFRRHMEILASECHPITMDDVLRFLQGQKDLPRRSVIVTFDDGYADNCEIAAPILEHYGIAGVFYIGVGPVCAGIPPWYCRIRWAFNMSKRDQVFDLAEQKPRPIKDAKDRFEAFQSAARTCACLAEGEQESAVRAIEKDLEVVPLAAKDCPFMNVDQVREIRRRGHTVGSHTVTHPNMAYIDAEKLEHELAESKRKIEEMLGEPVVHFSYPSPILEPHYTEKTMEASARAGYRTAVTCTSGPVRASSNPLAIPRIHSDFEELQFRWNLEYTFLNGKP